MNDMPLKEENSALAPISESPLKVWLERDGALLRLRLARPKANLIDAAMIAALHSAFETHRANPGLLAALVDHEGPHFSFGASVEEHLPAQCERMLKRANPRSCRLYTSSSDDGAASARIPSQPNGYSRS